MPTVTARVVRPCTSRACWKAISTATIGSGASSRVGTTANAASSGGSPETVPNQTPDSGVNATSASSPADTTPSPAPKRASTGTFSSRRPASAITTSWKAKPGARNRNDSPCTTGNTASDSTGKGARPMKKVRSGCTVSPISEVSARGK